MVLLQFLIDVILPTVLTLGSTQPLTGMSKGIGKGGRYVGLTNLQNSCADCLKIWDLQRPGTIKSCSGIALPLPFTSEHTYLMKINPSKSKAIRFTRARVKDPLNYSLLGTLIPEASSCKYLGIILCSDLSWADQVNYTVIKAWKALHFTMRILKMGNSNTKSLAYISLVVRFLNMVQCAGIRTGRDK